MNDSMLEEITDSNNLQREGSEGPSPQPYMNDSRLEEITNSNNLQREESESPTPQPYMNDSRLEEITDLNNLQREGSEGPSPQRYMNDSRLRDITDTRNLQQESSEIPSPKHSKLEHVSSQLKHKSDNIKRNGSLNSSTSTGDKNTIQTVSNLNIKTSKYSVVKSEGIINLKPMYFIANHVSDSMKKTLKRNHSSSVKHETSKKRYQENDVLATHNSIASNQNHNAACSFQTHANNIKNLDNKKSTTDNVPDEDEINERFLSKYWRGPHNV